MQVKPVMQRIMCFSTGFHDNFGNNSGRLLQFFHSRRPISGRFCTLKELFQPMGSQQEASGQITNGDDSEKHCLRSAEALLFAFMHPMGYVLLNACARHRLFFSV